MADRGANVGINPVRQYACAVAANAIDNGCWRRRQECRFSNVKPSFDVTCFLNFRVDAILAKALAGRVYAPKSGLHARSHPLV